MGGTGTGTGLGMGDTGSVWEASAPPFWATSFSGFLGMPFQSGLSVSLSNMPPSQKLSSSSALTLSHGM